MTDNFQLRGILKGHNGWVTCIATSAENPDQILSGSRDKKLIVWTLTREDQNYGVPRRSLGGHAHFVQDIVISSDGQFALSGSWDGTLRLWDLNYGTTTRRFVVTLKTFCLLPSLLITDKLFLAQEIKPLSYGTLLENASIPLMNKDTLSGSVV